ncbi:hypothetical protein AK812_SmicGene19172 [Symbiodinium microadriaticum]|uniref:Uncharacterized protein n=1 Tax=Symbiodinium microadriaticum TaxID=2951 RepID=A0A1Q9DT84_SYMMI|nr:hypothetical protein AK812_SmicGene19172 [Symbiodinium microadriaticum]
MAIPVSELAAVTLFLMGYCSLADPGQLKKTRNISLDGIDLEQGERPFRAHLSGPGSTVERSDDMIITVAARAAGDRLGIVLDGYLALLLAQKGMWEQEIAVVPIFRIHIGLVCRNELAEEWKHHVNYVARSSCIEWYNELYDNNAFEYDRTRNQWDKGASTNCWNFWCWPRWPAARG